MIDESFNAGWCTQLVCRVISLLDAIYIFFLQQSPIAEGDEEEKTNGNPVSKSVHPLVLLWLCMSKWKLIHNEI